MNRIVVGVDGSDPSIRGLEVALEEARVHDAALDVVYAWSYPAFSVLPVSVRMPTPLELAAHGQDVIAKCLAEAGQPEARVRQRVIQGHPGPALVQAAEEADLLVVAARGLHGFRTLLLGSVSEYCAHHSPVPVLVARGEVPVPPKGSIMVGIDGSGAARKALAWAVAEAVARGSTVEAVYVWQEPNDLAWPFADVPTDNGTLEDLTTRFLASEVAAVDTSALPEPVRCTIEFGPPNAALRNASRRADLLVLGSRGRSAVSGLLLGSVTSQLIRHACRPVVIVPE